MFPEHSSVSFTHALVFFPSSTITFIVAEASHKTTTTIISWLLFLAMKAKIEVMLASELFPEQKLLGYLSSLHY